MAVVVSIDLLGEESLPYPWGIGKNLAMVFPTSSDGHVLNWSENVVGSDCDGLPFDPTDKTCVSQTPYPF